MANFGSLPAELGSGVWCIPANFNGFRVLPSLLQRCRSPEANQTLHDVWPSPGLVHYIYIFKGSCSLTKFCQVQNSISVQVLRSPILAALLHGTPTAGVSQTLRRGTRHFRWPWVALKVILFIANPFFCCRHDLRHFATDKFSSSFSSFPQKEDCLTLQIDVRLI